jgi:hypothetical protein
MRAALLTAAQRPKLTALALKPPRDSTQRDSDSEGTEISTSASVLRDGLRFTLAASFAVLLTA